MIIGIRHRWVLLLGTGILLAGAMSRFPVAAQNPNGAETRLAELLKERRDVLKARVDTYEKLVQILRSTPEELLAARNDLLMAEYELASDAPTRVRILTQKLDNAKQLEALAQQRKQAARGNEAEVLWAQANRLAVEVELTREGNQSR